MPAPLEGGRILNTIAALPGWSVWFRGEDEKLLSQPVVCWATVESENTDPKYHKVLSRVQAVVPLICTGAGGLLDATIPDDALGQYLGVTGPGETTERLLRLLKIDEENNEDEEENGTVLSLVPSE